MCTEWLGRNDPTYSPPAASAATPAATRASSFKNNYLSYSRLQLYEDCPQAFRYRYVEKRKDSTPAPQLAFGKLVHEVLEMTMRHQVTEELSGPLDLDLALRLYQQGWEASWLTGGELYDEGARQLRLAIRGRGPVNHWDVLGIEKEFRFGIGSFEVLGYVDLVERLPGDELLVTDYKTGALPQPWDVDGTLQLTLYDIAVRKLWPWARNVKLQLHQTRQGILLQTSRSEEQRRDAMAYVEALGRRTESDTTWEAYPGTRCSICAWRAACSAYRAFLERPAQWSWSCDESPETSGAADLDSIAQEHSILTAKKAAIATRLKETEKVLRAALKDEEEISAGGFRWSLYPVAGLSHPVDKTVEILNRAGVEGRKSLAVDKEKLRRVLSKIEDPARRELVKLEIESVATNRIYPRLWQKGGGK